MVSAVSARIVAGPRDTAATMNSDVRLRCAAVGDPPPSVTWLKDGDPVIPSDYFRIVDGGSLRILGVVASDAGMYQCIAANSAGSTQATAELLVHVNGTQSRLIVTHTHTHTHARLTALCPGLTGSAGTRKVKPIWILLKQETVSGNGISWAICKSAPHSRQITTPAPHHSVFTGRMPFLPPNQQCKALKAL